VRLHAGIALLKLNQAEPAKAMLASVQGDEALHTLGTLWMSLMK
jgi:hypothetical protein